MIEAEVSALNQIGFASQFVDPEVESVVRIFHHHCFSCAQSALELRVSAPSLSEKNLRLTEAKESQFSHISEIFEGHPTPTQAAVARWPSLMEGQPAVIEFQTIASILGGAIGADQQGRRPYPSGGALYSAETLVIVGEAVKGVPPFTVAHYLPVSNRFELLPSQFRRKSFEGISSTKGVSFYLAYFINLKKAIFKYRSRGYRLAMLEIGSMYQQITNVAQEHGVASRVLAGFSEYEFTKNCGLDSRLMLATVIHAFGFAEGINAQ